MKLGPTPSNRSFPSKVVASTLRVKLMAPASEGYETQSPTLNRGAGSVAVSVSARTLPMTPRQ